MANMEQIFIERKMTQKELTRRIKELEKEVKILERLKFIDLRYNGYNTKEACDKLGVAMRSGYIWQERWNEEGYEGLIPKYGHGKPSKLDSKQREELKKYLVENNITDTKEIKRIIKEDYDIEFSNKHIWTIKKQLGIK